MPALWVQQLSLIHSFKVVHDDDDLLIVADDGTIIRTAASGVSILGRATQGVRIMRPNPGAKVISVARTDREEEDGAEAEPSETSETGETDE